MNVFCCLLAAFLLACSALGDAAPRPIDTMRTQYTLAMEDLKKQAASALDTRKPEYVRALDQLAATQDAEIMAEARRELARMAQHSFIPEEAISKSDKLRNIQRYHQAQFAAAAADSCERMIKLNERYVEFLRKMEHGADPDLSREIADEIELAMANPILPVAQFLREIHERAQKDPQEFALLRVETAGEPARTVRNPSQRTAEAAKPEPRSAPIGKPTGRKTKLYAPGQEPNRKTRRETLAPTGVHGRGAIGYFNLEVSTYISDQKIDPPKDRFILRHFYRTERPRILLRYTNQDALKGAVMVIQYGVKPRGGGSARLHYTEHVPLPPMERGGALVVDGSGISRGMWMRSTGRVMESSSTDYDPLGYIISVYADDGKLLVQQATTSALASFGLPDRPPATNEKTYSFRH